MQTSLRVENLWKSYAAGVRGCSARVWALRGCSLSVHGGDRIAIVGRPGAGKSALLQCIAGLRSTDAGRVESSFARIVYATALPLPAPPCARDATLYLVDDTALAGEPDITPWLDGCGERQSALIVAARDVARIAPHVRQLFTLRDGRLTALPRAPVRRVAERAPLG